MLDLYERAARQAARALFRGRATVVVRSTRTVEPGAEGRQVASGFDPLTGHVSLPESVERAFATAFDAQQSGRQLVGEEARDLEEAARTLLFDNLMGIYPLGSPHLPGQPKELLRDRQRYTWPAGFALAVGHLDWFAQTRLGEFIRLIGLQDFAPDLAGEPLTQPYSGQVAMAKGFAAAGGYRLLGFADVDAYLEAQARQNDMTRFGWMANRIIRANGMPETQETHDQLVAVIAWAFREPMPVGPGNEAAGWQLGADAYRALAPLMRQG